MFLFRNGFFRRRLSHRFALQFDPIGLVNQSIQQGIGDGGAADQFMPPAHRELIGCDYRSTAHPIIQYFPKIAVVFGGGLDQPQIVDLC